MTLGEEVRFKRVKKGMTQDFLAKLVGITQAQISCIERGASDCSFRYVVRLAFILDINLNDYVKSPYRKKVQSHG